jgi:hypothetical protein
MAPSITTPLASAVTAAEPVAAATTVTAPILPVTPILPINPIVLNPVGTSTALSPTSPSVTTTTPSATVTVPNTSGSVTFQLIVTDNLGVQSAPATVTINIQGAPTAVIAATPNPVAAGKPITLSGAGSTASGNGTIASFDFSLVTPGAVTAATTK